MNKQTVRMCLEVLCGIRDSLTVAELESIGYVFPEISPGVAPKYDLDFRTEGDDAWRGVIKIQGFGFDQSVRVENVRIKALVLDVLMKMLPSEPKVKSKK